MTAPGIGTRAIPYFPTHYRLLHSQFHSSVQHLGLENSPNTTLTLLSHVLALPLAGRTVVLEEARCAMLL